MISRRLGFRWALALASAFLFSMRSLHAAAAAVEQYQIRDHGQSRTFVIATDELQRADKRQTERISPAANTEALRQQADQLARATGKEVRLVLHPLGGARSRFSRRILTRDVLLQVQANADVQSLAQANGATITRSFDFLPGHYILTSGETAGALGLAENLRGQPGVISAEPQLAHLAQKKLLPDDTLFTNQWHLLNTAQL